MTPPPNPHESPPGTPAPAERFRVDNDAIRVDALMRRVIVVGGIGVIASVLGLFLFILYQAFPLFRQADVTAGAAMPTPPMEAAVLVGAEYGYAAMKIGMDGRFQFVRVPDMNEPGAPVQTLRAFAEGGADQVHFLPSRQRWCFAFAGGEILEGRIAFASRPDADAGPAGAVPRLVPERRVRVPGLDGRCVLLDRVETPDLELLAAATSVEDGTFAVGGLRRTIRKTPFGEVRSEQEVAWKLEGFDGRPVGLVCGPEGRKLYLLNADGRLISYRWEDGRFQPIGGFQALTDAVGTRGGGRLKPLHGRRTLAVWSPESGPVFFYTPVYDHTTRTTRLVETKRTGMEGEGLLDVYPSAGNRAILLVRGREIGLHFVTTNRRRWSGALPFQPELAAIDRRYDAIHFLDRDGGYHRFALSDPYPEAGFTGLFRKVHYEGRAEPEYAWQSSGGTDEFEPKLSLMPLIFGSLKGTLFALLFSIPIALAAAVYASQFMSNDLRQWIKPQIELMASIPSVILGLLAAIWFGPLIVRNLPALAMVVLLVPLLGLAGGLAWSRIPARHRRWLPPGRELYAILPFFFLAGALAWFFGEWLEQVLFRVTDPATGAAVGDFALWWTTEAGMRLEQRNSVIIGIFMGFAVIPLIFSVAEEALSSVPRNLVSGSLALGASRWQTTRRIVIPTAAAGILSGIMIGVGRAVGETMIVLMAAGNTPLMDLNLLSGFRALSANIAIELPEAAEGGLLYRTMFLGAALLFFLSFIFNTLADFLRSHLRKKFQVIE